MVTFLPKTFSLPPNTYTQKSENTTRLDFTPVDTVRFGNAASNAVGKRIVRLPSLALFNPRLLIERLEQDGITVQRCGFTPKGGLINTILYVGELPDDMLARKAVFNAAPEFGTFRRDPRPIGLDVKDPTKASFSEKFYQEVLSILR